MAGGHCWKKHEFEVCQTNRNESLRIRQQYPIMGIYISTDKKVINDFESDFFQLLLLSFFLTVLINWIFFSYDKDCISSLPEFGG